ncbi:MAG: aminomethyl transferase family protein [Ignavibacteriae bacterium]|nr:aminomethyl transferase family protein [Ignavibacteriota bacterium]
MSSVKTGESFDKHKTEAELLMEYHGLTLPAFYSSPESEFDAATNGVALIDRSWIGRIEITGADRLDLLHRLSTNDLLKSKPGDVVGSVITTEKGRLIDYVTLLVGETSILVLTSPGNEERLSHWIEKYCIMDDVKIASVTSSTALISLLGPKVGDVAAPVLEANLRPNKFQKVLSAFGGATVAWEQRSGLNFVDILVDVRHSTRLWDYISSKGDRSEIVKVGVMAYEAFRISQGIPQTGGEISESYNPYEAGLIGAVSFTKGCYIGQEVIARLDTYHKVQRQVVGLVIAESTPGESGGLVMFNSLEIGVVTSMSPTPIRGKTAALAIVRNGTVKPDDVVTLKFGEQKTEATVCEIPIQL